MSKNKIAKYIRALRAKTTANGCTEEEAAAAADKAAKLLEQYNMTIEESDLRENEFTSQEHSHDDIIGKRLWKVADAIAYMVDIKFWTSRPGEIPAVTFFGFDHEVQIASYLLDICRTAMKTRHANMDHEYRLLRANVRRRRIEAFIDGMADRLHQRIKDMKPKQPTGTGLVVLRKDLIKAALEEMGINLKDGKMRSSNYLDENYYKGRHAADAVSLNPGLKTQDSSSRITGKG